MSMRPELRRAYLEELASAEAAEREGQWDASFGHLERAHILSQRHTLAHTATHLRMLRYGWIRGNPREIRGQVVRAIAALTKSKIWVPVGNTGGANVNPLKPMPIPADLRPLLD